MGKYSSLSRRPPVQKGEKLHPIWYGIGCIIVALVPLISFAIAVKTVEFGLEHNWPIPYQLLGVPRVPEEVWILPNLALALQFVISRPNLYAHLAFMFINMILIGGVLSLSYSIAYRVMGPPRYGPLDAPPEKNIKIKRYRR